MSGNGTCRADRRLSVSPAMRVDRSPVFSPGTLYVAVSAGRSLPEYWSAASVRLSLQGAYAGRSLQAGSSADPVSLRGRDGEVSVCDVILKNKSIRDEPVSASFPVSAAASRAACLCLADPRAVRQTIDCYCIGYLVQEGPGHSCICQCADAPLTRSPRSGRYPAIPRTGSRGPAVSVRGVPTI